MEYHNNPLSRFYVNREQLLRGNHENIQADIQTDIPTGILLRVFSFITLVETCASKIWRDLDQCTDIYMFHQEPTPFSLNHFIILKKKYINTFSHHLPTYKQIIFYLG